MRQTAETALGCLLVLLGGCGVLHRELAFDGAIASGTPDRYGFCRYPVVSISGATLARLRILLPDGRLLPADAVTVDTLRALDTDPPPRADRRYAYPIDWPQDRGAWVVTWLQHYHLTHPVRIMTGRRDETRQFIFQFRDGKVISIAAVVTYSQTPGEATWVPTFAAQGDERMFRLPLSASHLVDMLGPVRSRREYRSRGM